MNKIHLIGNAHLDPVWLWRWQEGFSEILSTFRSALDRMKEFDDFKFTSACSSYYMWIEEIDKDMFNEIKQRVKEGRWNIVGGWFIQPDCNIPSGESFARHALISQRYFKEKFGITVNVGYNVDSFGHNGSLPKILKNSRMDSYVFMRPGNHEKELPSSLFYWQSMDGSAVKTFRIPQHYGINNKNFELFNEIGQIDEGIPLMAFYGVGNHGGGATIELLAKMEKELDERYVFSTPNEYFETVKDCDVPTVEDDLQYHAKGCYSAVSEIKSNNRMAENMLTEAEKYSVLAESLLGVRYPGEDIKKAWNNVLFNQFHDILGGCSIKEAYKDARWAHGESLNIASRVSNNALVRIARNIDTCKGMDITAEKKEFIWVNKCTEGLGIPLIVFNPLPYEVTKVVNTGYPAKAVKTDEGTHVPVQMVRASKTLWDNKFETAFVANVPALGYKVYRLHITDEKEFKNPLICTENTIENEKIKLILNPETGEASSIFVKDSKTELLSGETKTLFMDETHCDTWAHTVEEFKNVAGVFEKGSVHLIEKGPVRATLRSVMKLYNTEITRDYTIEQGACRVHVKTTVDFHEKHKLLKFTFPCTAENGKCYAKIPFGFIERPIDGTEQVCGEWVCLCDKKGGVILSNDSKYSFDADKNELSLTVLRGAIFADHCLGETKYHDEFCDYMEQGLHTFCYTISPFESLAQAEKEGELINTTLSTMLDTFHKGVLEREYSGISISKENIAVTALKKQEDGKGWMLRCYETENKDTDVEISLFGTTWTASFGHSQVKTFIIDKGTVSESDFIEWRCD